MPSFVVTEQRSSLRYVVIAAQAISSTPTFTLSVDGETAVTSTFSNATTGSVQDFQLFVDRTSLPAIGLAFQVSASGAIIKDVQFPLETLNNYNRKQLFQGIRIGYIGQPEFTFYLDGAPVTPTVPTGLPNAAGPQSAMLYFPAMSIGYVMHIKRTADSGSSFNVNNYMTSLQFLSQPIDE
jgi:hypothetical protein